MNNKEIISEIISDKLFPRIYKLVLDLELKEYEFGGKFLDNTFADFKIDSSGQIYMMKLKKWQKWNIIDEMNGFPFSDGNDTETLRVFMLCLSKDVAILKYMKEEIKKSIREVCKNVNTEFMFKELLTEKKN